METGACTAASHITWTNLAVACVFAFALWSRTSPPNEGTVLGPGNARPALMWARKATSLAGIENTTAVTNQ
ncbi:hypothetical protein F5Y17DRAFT_462360 [Xylariaceae sp. FL0594]|nr:hypothetical protein F5Y17DRAFT_462360 [Xylariaceae sp. FL0594]